MPSVKADLYDVLEVHYMLNLAKGLQLPDGALIEIVIPVYGLDDAPASWRTTVAEYLVQDLGCERNLVEPCWFSKFCPHTGECLAQILVEVDDFIIAARQDNYQSIKDSMQKRFNFGKWQEDEAEYAGRHIRCTEDAIFIDQYKYIHEQIHPIVLPRGRRQQTDQQLSRRRVWSPSLSHLQDQLGSTRK